MGKISEAEEKLKHEIGSIAYNKAVADLENQQSQDFEIRNDDRCGVRRYYRRHIADIKDCKKETSKPKKYFFMG